ncbi:MAG: hypothetical protein MZV65_52335 [Chromatiales bacterium]|nr:hypothetical protein [Chromatiales bacterium]
MVQLDRGEDIFTRARISHIRLFRLTFIFFITDPVFVRARVRPNGLKAATRVTPFSDDPGRHPLLAHHQGLAVC